MEAAFFGRYRAEEIVRARTSGVLHHRVVLYCFSSLSRGICGSAKTLQNRQRIIIVIVINVAFIPLVYGGRSAQVVGHEFYAGSLPDRSRVRCVLRIPNQRIDRSESLPIGSLKHDFFLLQKRRLRSKLGRFYTVNDCSL